MSRELDVRSLSASYGKSRIIRNISFSVDKNQTVALLGRNGAGKTTTIKSIMGVTPPQTTGEIRLDGEDLSNIPLHKRFKKGISWVPERRRIFTNLTVTENLEMGHIRKDRDGNKNEILELFPRLEERLSQKAGTMSGGEQQMLTLGRALISSPDIMLIDEPFEGLMPSLVDDFVNAIESLSERDMSIIITEQKTQEILQLADVVLILQNGELVFSGDPLRIKENPELQEEYLGVSE
jgi:branched-chain amino acid transport system ATP-binding protein